MFVENKEYNETSLVINDGSNNASPKCCSYNTQDNGDYRYSTLNNIHTVEDIQNKNDDATSEKEKRFVFSKTPRRKKIVLCLCVISNLLASTSYSLLGPFFPLVAQKKGMNLTMIGFVFGLYELVIFLTSPLMGNFMTRIGSKFMFISGIFVGGCSAILFGLLNRGPGGTIFLVMCLLVRALEAVGFSAFMTSSMTIVSSEFEEHAGSVVALLKVSNALGNLVGPFLAGILYDIGGFGLPLYCTGVPILINGVIMYFYLPVVQHKNNEFTRETTILNLLKSPLVLISILCIFVAIGGLLFYIPILSMHLKPFGLSSIVVGALYMIGPLFYMPSTLVFGYIADVKDKQSAIIIPGHFICCVAWALIGPAPFLPFLPYNPQCISVGIAVLGFSLGGLIIPPMKCMLIGAYELNYKKGPDTLALVSGLFNSVYALGGFVGPFVGGVLAEQYGIQIVFTGFAIINLAMFVLTFIFFTVRHLNRRRQKVIPS